MFWAGPDSVHWSEENEPFWTQYWIWIAEQSDDPAAKTPAGKAAPPAWAVRRNDWFLFHRADTGGNLLLRVGDATKHASVNTAVVRDLTDRYYAWTQGIAEPLRGQQDLWQPLVGK